MKFGFELEFSAPSHKFRYIQRFVPNGFELGIDSSATCGSLMGCELRTVTEFDHFPYEAFRCILGVIKENGGRVHKSCGFHIHFSGRGLFDIYRCNNELRRRGFWKHRQRYCGEITGRYAPMRQVLGDHYEIRIFNGSLNIRALKKAYEFVYKFTENYALNEL